ncbi:M28 family peptidase [Planctomicrobium sp. SH664]|uniref:M28 family peptidase n=1 Tax=Planctomicrobium sp. SH664 TaxID=3448125 RepID=UPI003F5BD3F5
MSFPSSRLSARRLPHDLADVVSRGSLALFFLGLCASIALAGAPAQEPITADHIRPHITFLADPARGGRSGTAKQATRDYIIREFYRNGLQPFFAGEWSQTVPARETGSDVFEPAGENIAGFVPGTDPELKREWIIVNAHYDHLGVRKNELYPGADDNASGVAMLLEVSRRIAASPLKRSVAFVAFDFEESLLWGSRWFMAHSPVDHKSIKVCLTADMIGRSLGDLDLPMVFILGAEHSPGLRDALVSTPTPEGLELAHLGTDMIGTRSDYGPFRDHEIPYLFFSTGEHPDYHTPRDVPERIDYEKSAKVDQLILDLVRTLGNAEEPPRWSKAEYQKLQEAQAIHRVAVQVLKQAEEGTLQLSSMHKFFVSQVKSKTGYMLKKGSVSDQERPWLVRSAQVLLLSVF